MKAFRAARQVVRSQSTLAKGYAEGEELSSQDLASAAMKKSIGKVADFWSEAGKSLTWSTKWNRAADFSDPRNPKWFTGGRVNTCYDCVDRHVEEGRGDQVAILFESAVSKTKQRIVFSELYDTVSRLAAALVDSGLRTGDRVMIFMPSIPQAIFAMLACSRIGAIYIPVSGPVSVKELAAMMDHAKPRVVITANAGVEAFSPTDYKSMTDEAIGQAEHKPTQHFVYQRSGFAKAPMKRVRDVDLDSAIRATRRQQLPVPIDANQPLFIEYLTDQTGILRGIARPAGGHTAALSWTLENMFGVRSRSNEKWFVANDASWASKHSLVVHAPLMNAATSVLFEGSLEAPNCFALVDKYDCNVLLTSPSTVRALYAEDPDFKHANHFDMAKLRHVILAGEGISGSVQWRSIAERMFRKPAYNSMWHVEAKRPVGVEVDQQVQDQDNALQSFAEFGAPKLLDVVSAQSGRKAVERITKLK